MPRRSPHNPANTPRTPDPNAPLPGWTVERHLLAYAAGYFPMADPLETTPDGREIGWFNPPRRAILPLTTADGLHIPRSVARDARRRPFKITTDRHFNAVLHACAPPRTPDDLPWINQRIIDMNTRLFQAGFAHSIEITATDEHTDTHALVGGIYGLAIGAAFFAESMFHTPKTRNDDGTRHPLDGTGASSVALVTLAAHLRDCNYQILDIQIINDHTARFGAKEIQREDFLSTLENATTQPDRWRPLDPDNPPPIAP